MATSISADGREFRHTAQNWAGDPKPGRNRVVARHASDESVTVYAFRHDGEAVFVNLIREDARALGQWLVEKTEA